ncbi:hypothetical protein TNCV_3777921 [Trichonephila clavipes]|nr:hypothetical protein TNCV_3777921 [Trichonephila clavipes]
MIKDKPPACRIRALMPLKIHRVEGLVHVKSVEAPTLPVCVVWIPGGRNASSDVILITWPWLKIARFVANSPHIAL